MTRRRPAGRGRIKDELERVLAIDPTGQGGSADAALGQWYFEVPRLFAGNRARAEEHLRRAQRVLSGPIDEDWIPEDTDFKRKAAARLATLGP